MSGKGVALLISHRLSFTVEATVFDLESRARALCAAPAGCAFLLIAEESGLAPEVIAEMDVAIEMAAVAIEEVNPWFPAHDRVIDMALGHGQRLLELAHQILVQPAAAGWFAPLDGNRQEWVDFSGGTDPLPLPDLPERPSTGWECYAQKPEWGFWTSTGNRRPRQVLVSHRRGERNGRS